MKVATRRHAVREAPSRDSSSRSTRYSPAGCDASKPGSINAALKRTTVGVVRVVTCGFLRKCAHAPSASVRAEPPKQCPALPVNPWSARYHFRIRTKRDAAPGAAHAFTVENSEADGEASGSRTPPRPNQRTSNMRRDCASNKAVIAFYFYWLNKIRISGSKKSGEISLTNTIFYTLRNY